MMFWKGLWEKTEGLGSSLTLGNRRSSVNQSLFQHLFTSTFSQPHCPPGEIGDKTQDGEAEGPINIWCANRTQRGRKGQATRLQHEGHGEHLEDWENLGRLPGGGK